MRTLSRDEVKYSKVEIVKKIRAGAIFIYPTDTIYGIGCDATNSSAVQKIRQLKKRMKNPFSVIAPSKNWIHNNCEIDKKAMEWIEKLPGPYTLIMKLRNKDAVAEKVNLGLDTIGIRIPDHWISEEIEEIGIPIVTTSVNVEGSMFMTSLDNLNPEIKSGISFIIYEGKLKARPSKLVDLTKEKAQIIKR